MEKQEIKYEDLELACCLSTCTNKLNPKGAAFSFISGNLFFNKHVNQGQTKSKQSMLKSLGSNTDGLKNNLERLGQNLSDSPKTLFEKQSQLAVIDEESITLYAFPLTTTTKTANKAVVFYIKCKVCKTVCEYTIE